LAVKQLFNCNERDGRWVAAEEFDKLVLILARGVGVTEDDLQEWLRDVS
jgi:hypothetical protein